MTGVPLEDSAMHISDTGVLDAAAYAPAHEDIPEPSNEWSVLAVTVPLAALYALLAFLAAVATAASGAGVSWFSPE